MYKKRHDDSKCNQDNDNCHWLTKRIRWFTRLQFQEKRISSFWLLWPVLCFWAMDTLDPCSDDDINNDVSSLYVEIIDKNLSYYKCTICGRKLSRKRRLKTHSEQAWLLCWSICWSVSVKHEPSDDKGNKKCDSMLKASLRVQLFGKERNLKRNLKLQQRRWKTLAWRFQFWTSLYLVNTETVTLCM